MRAPHQVNLHWSYSERSMGESERISRFERSFFMITTKQVIKSIICNFFVALFFYSAAYEALIVFNNKDMFMTILGFTFLFFLLTTMFYEAGRRSCLRDTHKKYE